MYKLCLKKKGGSENLTWLWRQQGDGNKRGLSHNTVN